LSRRLKTPDQPSPPPALAAPNRAQPARPHAANDASDGAGAKAPMPRLGLRWRVPAGIAATVLAGAMAHQAWQASADLDRSREMNEVMPVAVPAAPPVPQQQPANEPPAAPQAKAAPVASKPSQPAARRNMPQALEVPSPPPPPPPPAPVVTYSYSAPAAPAPAAPPAGAAPAPSAAERGTVEVSGRRSRVEVPARAADRAARFSESAAQPDPKIWLAAIEEMMKAGLQRDALEEWDKFRAAWPDYPVAPETREKINALRN
jgi:hypothetical protein